MEARWWDQRRETREERQRVHDHGLLAVSPWLLEAIHHAAVSCQRQAILGERGSGDVAREPLQASRIPGADANGCVQRVAIVIRAELLVWPRGGGFWCIAEQLHALAGARAERDQPLHGCSLVSTHLVQGMQTRAPPRMRGLGCPSRKTLSEADESQPGDWPRLSSVRRVRLS